MGSHRVREPLPRPLGARQGATLGRGAALAPGARGFIPVRAWAPRRLGAESLDGEQRAQRRRRQASVLVKPVGEVIAVVVGGSHVHDLDSFSAR